MVIIRLCALFASGHALIASSHQLARILFPRVERLRLFFL